MATSHVIYIPQGKAAEYVKNFDGTQGYACNIYTGCDHGCKYCYARSMHARFGRKSNFDEPEPRDKFAQQFSADVSRLPKGSTVHLCFTTDPYNKLDERMHDTRWAIEALHLYGHHVQVLTKGGPHSLRDLDLFGPEDSYGATLTFTSDKDSLEWEPGAALPWERIEALEKYKKAGVPTWVSLEPVIDPEATLWLIDASAPFVDLYKVGKWNYDVRAKNINWAQFGLRAEALLQKLGKRYIIKEDLRKLMP